MQNEYLFLTKEKLDFPLDESITVLNESDESDYLVSNEAINNTQIYAPEINFYIKNSADDISKKIANITKLYDIRADNFDFAQYIDYEEKVGTKLLIVTSDENQEKYAKFLENENFTAITLAPEMITDVEGHIGKLTVTIQKNDEEYVIECDQIVWGDAPGFAMKQSGTYDPNILGFDEALTITLNNLDGYKYKNFITYDSSICQYHERREEICGKCAEVCPTVAILKEDETKHLAFSHIDCHGCGGCISVCPSGALDYTQMPRLAFTKISSYFEDSIALMIPSKMNLDAIDVQLSENVLPFMIEGEKYLHEAHLMTLLQTSGNPVIFYTDFISKGTGDAIRIVNEIFERKYHKTAIYICEDTKGLEEIFSKMQSIPECKYGINEEGLRKREIFSARLAHLVGDDDLGVVKTGEHIHYGNVVINEANCTLCLSCVGACNVRALTAHPEDNSLRFNPSICTNCTYCEVSCPENDCLSVIRDEISLNPSYFKQNIMAKDELFACVECGKEFAPTKAVNKIAEMMTPMFKGDELKIRTLYCCAECKPKILLQARLDEQMKLRSNA
ncbi:MAG: 4Fe-4S dicluster domain-containing protein [Sulfurospirillaceae bacterium]|nr:4Fe-4S dicluster domain-containing protein [Sulfurospirillaceae bacterium]